MSKNARLAAFRVLVGSAFVAVAALAAACSSTASRPVAPIFVATPGMTTTISLPVAMHTATPIMFAAVDGISTRIVLPAASAPPGATVAISVTQTLPAGIAPLATARRPQVTTGRTAATAPDNGAQPLLYFLFTSSQTITFVGTPGFTLSANSGSLPPGETYELAYFDPVNGWLVLGPFLLQTDGTYVYYGSPQGLFPITFVAGTTSLFAAYSTKTPPIVPIVAPTALVFAGFGDSINQTIDASESGYSGSFGATSSNTSVASVSPATSMRQFIVNARGVGNAIIYVSDAFGATTRVSVAIDVPSIPSSPGPTETPESTPTPIPSATPTTSPSPGIFQVSPTYAPLYLPASNDARFPSSVNITVHEDEYYGLFFAVESPPAPCTVGGMTYASISPAQAGPTDATFTITANMLMPNGNGLDCAFDISDDLGHLAQVRISIIPPFKVVGK